MTTKKRKKIFDRDRKINRPIILEQIAEGKKEAGMRVLARKSDLRKTLEGKMYVDRLKKFSDGKYITVKGNSIFVENQYAPTGVIGLKLSPVDKRTKMMTITSFWPKNVLEIWAYDIKREGIGTATTKRIIELANSITLKGEKMIVRCDTTSKQFQGTLNKLGFEEISGQRPGTGTLQKYELTIDKTKKKVKK